MSTQASVFLAACKDANLLRLNWFSQPCDLDLIAIRPEKVENKSCDVNLNRQQSSLFRNMMTAIAQADSIGCSPEDWAVARQIILFGFYAMCANTCEDAEASSGSVS